MRVVNRKKIVNDFGSLGDFLATTPYTRQQFYQFESNKDRKHYKGKDSEIFKLGKFLEEQGYMMEIEETK